ncbi:MAG: hypothetical protein R2713_01430 [Ilumatobacteraceae bacterium]|nr:hypothetical protein [Acidimicrobiales bacterium]MCB9396022.1 hypothetical protein [Acidimicrobiaceae bacterium]
MISTDTARWASDPTDADRLATLLHELDQHGVRSDDYARHLGELREQGVMDAPLQLARATLWHLGAGAPTDHAVTNAADQLLEEAPRHSR